jgi:transposase
MSDRVEELARRLVIGHKRDGRSVYDEAAKAELVAECAKPGTSVSRVARQAGVNANQLSRWIREQGQAGRRRATHRDVVATSPAFVPVAVETSVPTAAPTLSIQARLPNGVVIELAGCGLSQAGQLIQAFGRLRCCGSTTL